MTNSNQVDSSAEPPILAARMNDTETFDPESPKIRALQKRTLGALFLSAIFGRASMSVGFVVAALLAEKILGSSLWAGISTAAITIGTAFSATRLSSYMSLRGRRPGLIVGYAVAAVGALIAVVGGDRRLLWAYLFGLVLFGVGQGATNLARYAAADLAVPSNRGKAISYVVFASTIGAVGGAALAGPASDLAESRGLDPLVGPFIYSAGFFMLAGLVLQLFLRPDPLAVSGGLNSVESPRTAGFGQGVAAIMQSPMAILAVVALVISQAVMVMVMAMTPLHMAAHDQGVELVGLVLSAHTAGMFAFAPIAGWAADRFDRVPTIMVGAVVLIIATIMTALAGEAPAGLMFPGLYLLGLGWSFGMVGSSALLTDSLDGVDQVAGQGAADVVTSIVSGSAALVSGVVFTMAGYHVLSMIGIVASGVMLVFAFWRLRLEPTQRAV